MLFRFLKYLQPTHYFQLYRDDGTSVFPIVENLPKEIVDLLELENKYNCENSRKYDLSWQAIQRGYIGDAQTYKSFEKVAVADEYIFIKKNFSPIWVFYVFLLRLLSLKNPIVETKGWLSARYVKRQQHFNNNLIYPKWLKTTSLIEKNRLISVIIPTLNRYSFLEDVLRDFEKQDYKNFEIVIVDQSEPFQKEFYNNFNLKLNVIHQQEKALWLARNTAIKTSNGDIIALSEDDVRIGQDWLSNHLKCLDYFGADISAGVFYPENSQIPKERSFFALAAQFATGNALLYKNIFNKVGLFDRQFEKQRMGDGEFGARAYLQGFKSVSNPYASCIDVKAATGGLRQLGSWDAFRSKKWFAPRPVPSVLYQFRKYYGKKAAFFALLKFLPPSLIPYQFKRSKIGMVLGFVLTILIFPLILIQVTKSWRLASKKLKEGALIEKLN